MGSRGALLLLCAAAARGAAAPAAAAPASAFPGRGAFRRVEGRRLQAEGPKPARDFYVAEEAGHRLAYEYAGRVAGRVLDVDREPAVAALSCRAPADSAANHSVFQVRWRAGAVSGAGVGAARPPLRRGDFITGGAAWGCGPPGTGFVAEVLDVDAPAPGGNGTTTVLVRPASPLHAVQDLYIDLRWTLPGRRLDDNRPWTFEPRLPVVGFNVDANGTVQERNIDVGPLTCENCQATLSPSIQFRLETDGALPKHVSLTVGADLNVSLSVGLSQAALDVVAEGLEQLNATLGTFQRVRESVGPDLVTPALAGTGAATGGVLLPLFSLVTEALDIQLVPVFATDVLLFTTTVMELLRSLRVSVGVSARANFTVSWDAGRGFDVAAAIDGPEASVEVAGAEALTNLTAGLRACLGLHLRALGVDTPLTTLEGCPELRMFVQRLGEGAEAPEPPVELLASTLDGGRELCFEFQSFSTDADLDVLDADDPYAKVCVFGACRQTSHARFTGNTVRWSDGPLCLQVPDAALQDGVAAHVHMMEEDPVWDDQYTEPHALLLASSSCPGFDSPEGCTLADLDLPLHAGGTFARATLKVTRPARRRLATGEECRGAAVSMSMGVSARFGGFTYPSFFSRGSGQQVVDPVDAPAVRPNGPRTTCEPLAEVSAASAVEPAALRAVFAAAAAAAAAAFVWGP